MEESTIIKNIIKIRESKRFTKRDIADQIGMNEASYGRIESGKISLSFNHLARIASALNMDIIDILTYPDKYVKCQNKAEEPVEAILQIKLKKEKKEQVLKLIFGENNIEILNK